MAFIIRDTDNVRELFTSTGTTITLGGAVANSRAISSIAGIVTGDTFFGCARKGSEISVGIFTWTSSGGTVAQTTVIYSSNANVAVSFSSGVGEIFFDIPSRYLELLRYAAYASSVTSFGVNGATNPALQIDYATASAATGLKVTAAAAAAGVSVAVMSSGTNENLKIDAKGSGTISFGSVSTGAISLGRNTTVTGTLGVSSDFAINTNKFVVTASTGATAIAGPVDISGAAAGQIIFPATQNASANANTLDDYEEGTYTPTWAPGSGVWTTSSSSGIYTKVGNLVFFRAIGTITAFGTGAGLASIGLPFTAAQTGTAYGRETLVTGKSINGEHSAGTICTIAFGDGTTTSGANYTFRVSGCFTA